MADKHPYVSGSGGLVKAINHLRKSFPAEVRAETLKKLGIAPNNENYVINTLRFVGIIDEENKKTQKASAVFTKHNNEDFQKGLSEMVEGAYVELFALHGIDSWTLSKDKLISYFRETDHSSGIVGGRQANTFQSLATLCGHSDIGVQDRSSTVRRRGAAATQKKNAKAPQTTPAEANSTQKDVHTTPRDMGLTVRIEINLPAVADQETYDRIFKSIRENLLNGE